MHGTLRRGIGTIAISSCAATLAGCNSEETVPATGHTATRGVVQINDNGGFCWYQDERVIVDAEAGTMLVGSLATSKGEDGANRGGGVEVTSYSFATGDTQRVVLDRLADDDHDAPALLQRKDGRYLAMYTTHGGDKKTRYRVSVVPHDATVWGPTSIFDWSTVPSDFGVTYSNLFYLSAEDRAYDFARADRRSPNALVSTDQGDTWSYRGHLTSSPNVGYVNGYFKYASLGVDRIDFVGTEHHPRDFDTSIYHGYYRAGRLCLSDGTVLDTQAFDDAAPEPSAFTRVFEAGSTWDGEVMSRAWPSDLHVDGDGRPYVLFTCRANDVPANSNYEDHRFFYARWDGQAWQVRQLAKAGPRLFEIEQDYTGLGALVPGDPGTLYISTPIDPRDGTTTDKHEIYKGVTTDGGVTWSWTAVTHGSTVDNLRPVVPVGDPEHRPLLWLRGTMPNFHDYDFEVVALIE